MQMLRRTRVTFSLLTIAALLSACSDSTGTNQTDLGPALAFGNGTAQAYVLSSPAGAPLEIGVVFSESALVGLPTSGTGVELQLPAQASVAPFNHATLDWHPAGHPPAGVFNVPHLDVHFYTITPAARAAISPASTDFATKAARTPSAEFVPTGYVKDAVAIPRMGNHWTDRTTPEFNGQPFTRTFIYGSWDGTFTFYEPMFTKAFLDGKPPVTAVPLKIASQYAAPGSYPTSYKVGFDASARQYVIAISGLVPRP
ncbi:MAG TPA: DUF5602 domain-containing protein [Gemmatimonadaceae bacterium]|nr:DUF5602 domain-containing protein [Gemmatimonadaceae bacterium]